MPAHRDGWCRRVQEALKTLGFAEAPRGRVPVASHHSPTMMFRTTPGVEDAVVAKTRSVLLALMANGGVPEAGALVSVAVEIPRELLAHVRVGLPSLVALVTAANLRTALTAPNAVSAVETQ